jgi:hypothetical protein
MRMEKTNYEVGVKEAQRWYGAKRVHTDAFSDLIQQEYARDLNDWMNASPDAVMFNTEYHRGWMHVSFKIMQELGLIPTDAVPPSAIGSSSDTGSSQPSQEQGT